MARLLTALCLFAMTVGPAAAEHGCRAERVYGTVRVIDEALGLFGLIASDYEFIASPDVNLGALDGQRVLIVMDEDCGVRAIRVLDGRQDALT